MTLVKNVGPRFLNKTEEEKRNRSTLVLFFSAETNQGGCERQFLSRFVTDHINAVTLYTRHHESGGYGSIEQKLLEVVDADLK